MKYNRDKTKSGYFVFREVADSAELLEHLRLRYKVLADSSLSRILRRNSLKLDLDEYDLRSRHFILVHYRPGGSRRIVGGQRGVYLPDAHYNRLAAELIREHSATLRLDVSRTAALPCFTYLPTNNAVAVQTCVQKAVANGESIAESSRFHLDPEYAGLRLAVFLARSVIAAYILGTGTPRGVTFVAAHHKRFYIACGFRQITGTSDKFYPALGLNATALEIEASNIHSQALSVLKRMSGAYVSTDRICYNPPAPDCFTEPSAEEDESVAAVA